MQVHSKPYPALVVSIPVSAIGAQHALKSTPVLVYLNHRPDRGEDIVSVLLITHTHHSSVPSYCQVRLLAFVGSQCETALKGFLWLREFGW